MHRNIKYKISKISIPRKSVLTFMNWKNVAIIDAYLRHNLDVGLSVITANIYRDLSNNSGEK